MRAMTEAEFIKWVSQDGKVIGKEVFMNELVPPGAEHKCQNCGKAHDWAVGDTGHFENAFKFVVEAFDAAEVVFAITHPETLVGYKVHFFKGRAN